MKLLYPCLVLDHDDTVVASTPAIHYPTFMKSLSVLRPQIHWTLEEYMDYNFEPGFEPLCWDILKFTREEEAYQEAQWKAVSAVKKPPMFEGMPELLKKYRAAGGKIAVISHSSEEIIARDYREQCGFEPELIYGWERGEGRRKPSLWPMKEVMRETGFAPNQLLMVDDMKPASEMAHGCKVPFAFAGWGNPSPKAHAYMKEHAEYPLETVSQLEKLILSEE